MPFEDQVVSIFAGTQGYLDKIPVGDVTRFESALLSDLKTNHPEVLETIRSTKDLGDEVKGKLKAALDAFAKTFG